MEKHVLEASTNTHVVESPKIKVLFQEGSTQVLETDRATVHHGEHNVITMEPGVFGKFTQQEYNPVTRKMQNAFD